MDFEQDFRLNFQDKYQELQLKEVVVKKREGVCTITFLYPSTSTELTPQEKKEIISWIKNYLQLDHIDVRVKFLRVFVEEKLILKSLLDFINEKYKLVATYLSENDVKINVTNLDVVVDITVSQRIEKYFTENKVTNELAKHLKENFLTDFVINLTVNEEIVDEVKIEDTTFKTSYKPSLRYKVDIVEELIGKDILPQPQYISSVKKETDSVIFAGFINKLTRREYVAKKGKSVGQAKTYYSFVLEDEKDKIDCIYFCPKTKVYLMEKLEDCMYVLVMGSVGVSSFTNRLQLKVEKIAIADKVIETEEPKEYVASENNELLTVKTENLQTLAQGSMFSSGVRYNDKIRGKSYVVFDIETTGLDTNTDQIIELGAVKIVDGKIREKFSTFVKPTISIPFEVTRLTGITNDMVANAPSAELVLKDFYEFTRGCIISGHNVIDFDLRIVKRMGREYGLNFDNEIVDTLTLARHSHLLVSNFKLGTIVKYLGLTLEGAHRAWNDAYATAEVLLKLCEEK
ncbi:MAG: ribonuclease H-like domain-containing protein [Clostridia bacterium]|nr:ribonuclease H-like domain-containing protein [Clostridia bacterium]